MLTDMVAEPRVKIWSPADCKAFVLFSKARCHPNIKALHSRAECISLF